jgi:cytochrome c biogenesis protein CcdA
MSAYLGAFLLGNAAILSNVCVLPLYPGLIAFLAGTRLPPPVEGGSGGSGVPPPVETPPPGRGRLGRG